MMIMSTGKVGTPTSTVFRIKKAQKIPCDCARCRHSENRNGSYFTVCISVCIRRKGPNVNGIGPLSRRRSRVRKTSRIGRKTTTKSQRKGVDLMLYKEMLLIGEDYDYFIEMDPAGNGIRFMRVGDDDIRKWVAAIIDTGDGFTLAMLSEQGVVMKKLDPKGLCRVKANYRELLLTGFTGGQTIYDHVFIINYTGIDSEGVTICYCDDDTIYTIAICETEQNRLRFRCA